jgi:hypothetical protein
MKCKSEKDGWKRLDRSSKRRKALKGETQERWGLKEASKELERLLVIRVAKPYMRDF